MLFTSAVLLKLLFDKKLKIIIINSENLLILEIMILRDDSKNAVTVISLHESGLLQVPQGKILAIIDQIC